MRRLIPVLLCVVLAPAAIHGATSDLGSIAADLGDRPTADGWERLAAFLERYAKWGAAADARQRQIDLLALRDTQKAKRESRLAALLLARDRIGARDLDGAVNALRRAETSRAASWLRIEMALLRDDVEAAETELASLTNQPADEPSARHANLLYCAESLHARDVEELLQARIALARGDLERAVSLAHELSARAPALADAHVVASNALAELGKIDNALAQLKTLETRSFPAYADCRGVLLDRVAFNEGNIAARAEREEAAADYQRAIEIAEQREREFGDAVRALHLPKDHIASPILAAAVRAVADAAPEARNNLAQLLLEKATTEPIDIVRQQDLDRARKLFQEAAAARDYATPQYALVGEAKVAVALGSPASAGDPLYLALLRDPWNSVALDFAAKLTHDPNADASAGAAVLLVSTLKEAFPRDDAEKKYGAALNEAANRLRGAGTEAADAFNILLTEWRGDRAAAQELAREARARHGNVAWLLAADAELGASTGIGAAKETFTRASEALRRGAGASLAVPAWKLAAIHASASGYRSAAATQGEKEEAQRAKLFLASLETRERDALPWDSGLALTRGVITFAGSPVPGVTVTVQPTQGRACVTITDSAGEYRCAVAPGPVKVMAELAGFTITTASSTLGEQGKTIDLALRQAVTEAITVSGVTPEIIETLPTGRAWIDSIQEARVAPGVSVSGSSALENTYVADSASGGSTSVGTAFTEQLAAPVQLTAYGGHFGAIASAANHDVIGSIEGQLQPAGERASPKPVVVPTARRTNLNGRSLHGSAGGRIIKDKLWIFGEGTAGSTRGTADDATPTSHVRRVDWLGKVTWEPTSKTMTVASVNHSRENIGPVADDITGAAFGELSAISRNNSYDATLAALEARVIPTDWWTSEIRLSSTTTDRSLVPAGAGGEAPQVRLIGHNLFATGGVGYIIDRRDTRTLRFISNTTVWIHNNTISAGFSVQRDRDRLRDRLSGSELIDSFGAGIPTLHRYWTTGDRAEPAPFVADATTNTVENAYVEDRYDMNRLKLYGGIRWHGQSARLSAGQRLMTRQFDGRADATYDPTGYGRWTINGFLARVPIDLDTDDLLAFGTARRFVVTGLSRISGPYGGLVAIDPHLRGQNDDGWGASVSRQIGSVSALRVDLSQWRLGSWIEDFFCTQDNRRCIGNPGRGIMNTPRAARRATTFDTSFSSRVTIGKPQWSELQWNARYVWSQRRGNIEDPSLIATRVAGSDPLSRPAFDSPETTETEGPMQGERRHKLTLIANWSTRGFSEEHRLDIAPMIEWTSGAPRWRYGYSYLYGRYVTMERSGDRSPSVMDAYLEASYQIHIDRAALRFGVNVDHVLNRQTAWTEDYRWSFIEVPTIPPNTLNPTYLGPMIRVEPRTVRLFVKFSV